jgi:arabinogalactan oligomer/maltooligosaccharide transport system permease protein
MELEQNKKQGPNKFVQVLISIAKFLLDILLRVVFSFRDLGLAVWRGIKSVGNYFVNVVRRFKKGGLWTKIGHVLMGAGNFAHKQIVKGCIFAGIEILFIVYMITSPTINGVPSGAKALSNFFTLGNDKGMPISRIDLDSEIEAMLVEGGTLEFDLSDEKNYNAERLAVLRTLNIAGEYHKNGASEKFVVEANEGQTVKDKDGNPLLVDDNGSAVTYAVADNKYVIKDYRYNETPDFYGFNHYEGDKLDEVYLKSATSTAYVITSKSPIEKVTEETVQINGSVSQKQFQLYKYNGNDIDSPYTYILLIKVGGRKAVTVDLSAIQGVDAAYQISFVKAAVNTAVDNSFLMMLFGIVSFAIIALFIIVWNVSINSARKAEMDIEEGKQPTTFKEDLKTLVDSRFHITLLTPAVILLLVFTIIPTILMILIAFTNMNQNTMISGQRLVSWAGLENFANLFSSGSGDKISTEVGKNFGGVLGWTFIWAIIATFSCYFGGIFLALLLNRKDVKMKKMWRTIFILTIAIPQFITFLILRNMLTASGPINSLLKSLGIAGEKGIDFLQSGSGQLSSASGNVFATWPHSNGGRIWLARITVLVINLYVGIPYTMLMTSGILMNIPADLYEAATIDGANKWQMFRKITLPYIIFVTTPYLISSFIGNITSFNTIFLTTGGGPALEGSIAGKTDLLVTWLYKMTIDEYVYNAGSIIGILTFMITAFLTLVAYRNSKAYKEEDTFQ